MKILKIVLGIPFFFFFEFVARYTMPTAALFKSKEQKQILSDLAAIANQLNLFHVSNSGTTFRSLLNRLSVMEADFKHLVELAFILADPETCYEDGNDSRRSTARNFVGLILEYNKTVSSDETLQNVNVDQVMSIRRAEWKKDDFGYKWFGNFVKFGFVDKYMFYRLSGKFGLWLAPIKSGDN